MATPGTGIGEETVRHLLEPHVPSWKLPASVRPVDAIPRNAAGKILRDRLVDLLGG
jgi:acyl-CoA synthetase (AMP-forming)/AMP-acid ligase II